ncbi:hypothetical protein EYF80_011405 [Liparis tanakae]|uniref:Uncharacterized protein n=1 Tax=Liparis tanakae TaxID=230148 RepID=A0A4Z2IKW7_9TELE|nr:hypothetical protein EYF80_011405 [Liparis tanakae]
MGGVTGGVRFPLVWRGGVETLLRHRPPVRDRDNLGCTFFFRVSCSRRAASVMNLACGGCTGRVPVSGSPIHPHGQMHCGVERSGEHDGDMFMAAESSGGHYQEWWHRPGDSRKPPQPTAEQRHLLVTDGTSRPAEGDGDKSACLFSRRLIIKENVLQAAGHQMRRKTGQIKHPLCNYASQALGTTRKSSYFSEWAQAERHAAARDTTVRHYSSQDTGGVLSGGLEQAEK